MSEEEEFEFQYQYEKEQAAKAASATAEARPPTDVEAGLNSAAKGLMNLLNTPITLKNLAMMGLAKIPGIGDIPAVQDIANNPTPNYPMQFAEQVGFVDPKLDPQTGLQRMVDATVQGAVGGGPLGAVAGAVGQGVTEATGNEKLGLAAGIATALTPAGRQMLAAKAGKNAMPHMPVRDATLKQAQEAGLVVPPSLVKPTAVTNRLESFGGLSETQNTFKLKNAPKITELATEELGLPKKTPLFDDAFDLIKQEEGAVYREVAQVSPKAANALHDLRTARYQAKRWWNYFHKDGNPDAEDKALAFTKTANEMEQIIDDEAKKIVDVYVAKQKEAAKAATAAAKAKGETPGTAVAIRPPGGPVRVIDEAGTEVGFATPGSPGYSTDVGFATPSVRGERTRSAKAQPGTADESDVVDMEKISRTQGRPDLLDDLRRARVRLAKMHAVENATNPGDGQVSPIILKRMYDNGTPLTGNLELIAKFAKSFPDAVGEYAKIKRTGISGYDAVMSSIMGGSGFAALGPAGVALGALPLARRPVQNMLTQPFMQRRLLPADVNATLPTIDFTEPLAKAGLAGRSLLDVMSQQGGE